MNKLSFKNIFLNLSIYGTMHFLVDLICVGTIFSILKNQSVSISQFSILLVLYSVLAFGLQPILGFVSDQLKVSRGTTLMGCLFVCVSALIFMRYPLISIIFAGLGNAMFHVGGGIISLNLTPKKALAPGVFVAPGALGLLLGTLLGKGGNFVAWPFLVALATLCVIIFVIKKIEINYEIKRKEISFDKLLMVIMILIFLSIAVRSFIGVAASFSWKVNVDLLVILTLAVVIGKGIGGFLADKMGWIKVGVGSLILSIPFLILGINFPVLGIIGIFLFNITMPITLVSISNLLPGYPGFTFGITCLALLLGAFPFFFQKISILGNHWLFAGIIVFSAISLFLGLRLYFKKFII